MSPREGTLDQEVHQVRSGTGGSAAPRVSVGMPVFNGARYLAAAIEGILGQDHEDLELIIADNASTDATGEIALAYEARDPRVRYVRNRSNIGAAGNFNLLVDLARGEYFRWAAHDDVVAPGLVACCAEVLDREPDVVLAYPRAAAIDPDGTVTHTYASYEYATGTRAAERARAVLRSDTPCLECFGLTRRSVLLETARIGPYTGADRTLLLQLALRGRFHEVDEVLFFHRRHAERSVDLYRDSRARNAWFDPSRDVSRTSPRWRVLGEHVRSIALAPAPLGQRLIAAAGLPGWVNRHRRVLARELVASTGIRPRRRRSVPIADGRLVSG